MYGWACNLWFSIILEDQWYHMYINLSILLDFAECMQYAWNDRGKCTYQKYKFLYIITYKIYEHLNKKKTQDKF